MNRSRMVGLSAALVAVSLTGGALGASFLSTASADTTTTTSPAASAPTGAGRDPSLGGHRANGITETLLTGDVATKVEAAAKAAVPGATVDRVENDAEGATYEAHMTKADGSQVTVKINADFSVAGTEAGLR